EFLDASDEAQGDLYSRSLRTTEDNDNELTVDEDEAEADVYRRHLSIAALEQIFSTIRERAAEPSSDDFVIDDLNEFMADETITDEMIGSLFDGISESSSTALDPEVQNVEIADLPKLGLSPILNAIRESCPNIIVTVGDLEGKEKLATCRPKLVAAIKEKLTELKQRDPRPYKWQGNEAELNEWFGKLFPVNA
ncbi:unnamed protein product, partial [Didymodactylos carnosus]